jgi:phage protein D
MAMPRRAWVTVLIDGVDVTEDVSPDLIDFTYVDKASDEADSIELNVHDRDGKWIGPWYPETGTKMSARINVKNWRGEGDSGELDCGKFEIDDCDSSGPPDRMSIKAVSTPISSSMREEEKTKSWEDTTLETIAGDIAAEAGLGLIYEVESDIQLDRVEQEEKSDLAFLQGLCHEYGISLKVTDEKVVLFEESVYEQKPGIETFDKKEKSKRIKTHSFSQNTGGCVSSVHSAYKDSKSGLVGDADFDPPEPPATGQAALVNERPGDLRGDNFREGIDTASEDPGGTFDTGFKKFNETQDDFQDIRADVTDSMKRQAMAVAREKNKNEWTCTLTMVGNVGMVAGVTFELTSWGRYSGKYIITEATHKVTGAGGYTTEVKAHKVLVGY